MAHAQLVEEILEMTDPVMTQIANDIRQDVNSVVGIPFSMGSELSAELAKLPDDATKEEVEKAITEARRKAKNKPKTYEEIFKSFLAKYEEQGWYGVADGRFTPSVGQEILFVCDKRSQGQGAKVKHGYVSYVGFDKESNRWEIETTALRVVSKSTNGDLKNKLTNGHTNTIVLWRPMLEVPRLPKLTRMDNEASK